MNHIAELAGRDSYSRRYFMERTAQLTLGVGLGSIAATGTARAQAGGGKAKSLIYIFCSGGMSHLDTFDCHNKSSLIPNWDPVSTNVDGMRLGKQMTMLAKKADKIAVINSMMSTNGAHDQGRYIMQTAYDKRATIVHPTVGPFAQELLGKRGDILPDSVVIGSSTSNAGYLDPALSPLPIADPSGGVPNTTLLTDNTRFQRRMEIAQKLGQNFSSKYKYSGPKSYVEYYDQATRLLSSNELEAFDISQESNREAYGMSRIGQGCLLARRLVERNVRVIEINTGGFDMHEGIDDRLDSVITPLDQAIATLIDDLEAKGLLDSTLIAVGTEFGRTPNINSNGGRDHHPAAFSTMLAGGGISGGQVYGKSDKRGQKVESDQVSPADFLATIGYGLGLPLDQVIYSPTRRPFTFAHKGQPITKLYS